MAKKKKENTLQYLQMPLPQGRKFSKMTKVSFGGLNKRYTHDSGYLSMENNISTNEYPYLTPSNRKNAYIDGYDNPLSIFAFDDFIVVVYRVNNAIYMDYISDSVGKHTGILKVSGATEADDVQRSIVQFNVYDTPTDPLTGEYVKKLLVFPDKCSMFMKIVNTESNPNTWEDDGNENLLNSAYTDVMYCYNYGEHNYYYTVGYDKSKKKRYVTNKSYYLDDEGSAVNTPGYFVCDGLEAIVKSYINTKSETDESGATIYPPPESASHNYYYKNIADIPDVPKDSHIYRWCEYQSEDGETHYGWKISLPPAVPSLKYATVHLSRVFGVDDDRVYASGFNDYANWNLDTIDEYNESNSWCSPAQSNTKAGGVFTGITNFQGHIVCFKRDFMHEIYNTKNPFRLQDIYAEGTIDNRTIQDVDGKLIFVSEDDVKIYTGSNPRIIGYDLNMSKFEYAVSGTDNRNYYLYCEDGIGNKYLYVYDTYTELWSEESVPERVIGFAHNKNGMYMLCSNGHIYKMDTDMFNHEWSFETELITNKTVDIKHIKKLQMLVDIPETINGVDNNADDYNNSAYMKVYILYDDEEFEAMSDEDKAKRLVYTSKKNGKFPIRVKPRNTANYGFKLHFEGAGYVKFYELEIFIEAGGDLYV
jgi:hypothetical protein